MVDVLSLPWSCGSSNGGITTIYANLYSQSNDGSAGVETFLVGVFESWEQADHIVSLHNQNLADNG